MIFVADDWAEDHHDVYLMDKAGARLASRRLPEGMTGIRGLHVLIAAHCEDPGQVVVGIETDRGLWVTAMVSAGYQVWAINPMAVRRHAARYRDRHARPYADTTMSREPNPTALTPSCWPIWCALIATTTARWPGTAPTPRRSRCWPGPIRA